MKNNLIKGFTLVELLIVLVILAIIIAFIVAAINPLEQLKKAKDSATEQNAISLLSAIERYQTIYNGKNPDIKNSTNSYVCDEIVDGGPVFSAADLFGELSDWLLKEITQGGKPFYVGSISSGTKVCYPVESVKSIRQVPEFGCNISYLYYLCLPK